MMFWVPISHFFWRKFKWPHRICTSNLAGHSEDVVHNPLRLLTCRQFFWGGRILEPKY